MYFCKDNMFIFSHTFVCKTLIHIHQKETILILKERREEDKQHKMLYSRKCFSLQSTDWQLRTIMHGKNRPMDICSGTIYLLLLKKNAS